MNRKQFRILPASLALVCVGGASAAIAEDGVFLTRSIELASGIPPSGNWTTDRAAPDAVAMDTIDDLAEVMTIAINGDAVNATSTFHRTEGIKQVFHNGNAAEVDLYIDPAWANKPVRAGFWIGGEEATEEPTGSWGIIEFVTGSGFGPAANASTATGFRYWDSVAPGAWVMSPLDITDLWGTWVTLRVELDSVAGKYDYFINGTLIGSFAYEAGAEDITQIREIIFNSYDYSAADESILANGYAVGDYTVSWHNLLLDATYPEISMAVSAASPGTVINVNAGNFAGGFNIDKPLTIQGAGDTTLLTSGITISANDVALSSLKIEDTDPSNAGSGIATANNISDLTLTNVNVSGFSNGLFVDNTIGVDGLTVTGGSFDGNNFGWYFEKGSNNSSNVVGVRVTGTTFNDNKSKGIYAEKLSDAIFDNISVINSGTDLVTWPPSNGVDINLKWSAYSDITIQNSLFENGGLYTESLQGNLAGVLVIKARSDGSYASPAATLTNVWVINNEFTATNPLSIVGLRLGEPTKNNAGPTNVTVTGNTFSGYKTPFLNTTLAPLAASMVANNTFADSSSVKLLRGAPDSQTTPAVYTTLTDAIAGSTTFDMLSATGTFAEDVTLSKPLNLDGNGSSFLTGMITVTSPTSAIQNMDITNPAGFIGIYVKKVGNVLIQGNNLHAIGTTNTGNSAQAIYVLGGAAMGNIGIIDNEISNVGNSVVAFSNKAIHFGDAESAVFPITNVAVIDNDISNINAATGKGAYGISFNYGSSTTGVIDGLTIEGNDIQGINGGWVHAIALETNTSNTTVVDNYITGLSAAGTDEVGVFFEKNASSDSVEISQNIFAGMEYGVALHPDMVAAEATANASHNYWGNAGGPSAGAKAGPGVTFTPWYISTTFNANQLSNFVEPSPPPPPPAPVGEEVSDIIDEVEIPDAESGETISEEAVTVIEEAATASTALAESVIENIETATTDSAIGALDVIGGVLDITGNAASNTTATSNTAASDSVTTSGAAALGNFAQVIAAIDTKATTSATVLTPVQKESVQAATVTAAAAAVKVLAATPTPAVAQQVLASLSNIITSNVNMGVSLTAAQADTLEDAAEQATDPDADLDTQLGTSVTIKPVNKEVISKTLLTEALAGSGVTEAQLDTFLAELAAAINPASVVVGDTNGEEALTEGFNNSLGGSEGSVGFDAETGVTTFTIGGSTETEELNGRSISALTADLVIPARVISSNVVATSFPDGIKVLANGSVVITSNQIASVVVPASYDPINFFADLNSKGTVSVDDTGNILLTAADFRFSGTFDYTGVGQGEPAAATTVTLPTGANESDPGYVFTVTYRDGTTQTLQPYLEADAFVASAQSRGLDVKILRNTGIVLVSGRQFRPSYFVDALDAATEEFFNSNKDASGVAYRPLDVNADGKLDYEVITATGVQVAYGL